MSKSPFLVIANWKSHKSATEIDVWFGEYEKQAVPMQNADLEVALAPAFVHLHPLAWRLMNGSPLKNTSLAVQDLSPFPAGAYTGAVSTQNLANLNIKYALVGHSERRRYFQETHTDVANKVDQALQAGIKPIVCIDEQYLQAQAAAISNEQLAHCYVAYEPLEAIGSGDNAPVEDVKQVFEKIKEIFGDVPVIYGGSVNAGNVSDYVQLSGGLLVGSASLKVTDFMGVISAVQKEL